MKFRCKFRHFRWRESYMNNWRILQCLYTKHVNCGSCEYRWHTRQHLQNKDAKMWNQNGFLYKGKTLAVHSKSIKQKSSPVQVFPSPEYPSLQAHTYNPTVLRHTALTSQLWELVEHSSISGRKSEKTCLLVCSELFINIRSFILIFSLVLILFNHIAK